MSFVDDHSVIAKSQEKLKSFKNNIPNEGKKIGLDNTEHMVKGQTQKLLTVKTHLIANDEREYAFECLQKFCSLEVITDETGHEEQEREARMAKGTRKYGFLKVVMKLKYLSRK